RAQMPQQGHEAVGLDVAEGDGGRPEGVGLRVGMVARPDTRRNGRGLHSNSLPVSTPRSDRPGRETLPPGHVTFTSALPVISLFRASVTVMVWFPRFRRTRPAKACLPL